VGLLLAVAAHDLVRGAEPLRTGPRWEVMDYGPFLTASIEAPQPRTNMACKGIAIDLGAGFGGTRREAVVFDTDLLRYSAGWMGNFVALKGVVFDGEHWAYPRIDGPQLFGNPAAPGWASEGRFADPREHPYGPLPRSWAHWKGLYLHGRKVILSYTVGDMAALEMPGLERRGELTAFSRTLNLSPSTNEQIVQVAFDAIKNPARLNLADLQPAATGTPASQVVVLLASRLAPATGQIASPVALDAGLLGRWEFNEAGGNSAADDSGQGRTLRLNNVSWTDAGHERNGLQFDGKHFAEVSRPDDFDSLKTDLTVAAWIKTTQDGTILARTTPGDRWVPGGTSFFVRDGRLTCDVGWVGAVAGARSVTDGRWHHVAFTWSRADRRVTLFLDGEADGGGRLKPGKSLSNAVVRVGFTAPNFPASPWFRGFLDGLRIYGRALAAEEVAALAGAAAKTNVLAVAVVGASPEARWLTPDGHIRLQLPASRFASQCKILLWSGARESLPAFVELVKGASPPEDLAPLTRGGPPRWREKVVTRGQAGTGDGPYVVDTLTEPDQNPWQSWMRFGGLDLFEDGQRAALSTWNGDVWIVSGVDGDLQQLTWQRIATGLFQPLGLKIVNGQIYALGRDQITRLHDLNGDGEADFYENFNNDCMVSEHFHEFALDLKTGPDGSFYYLKCACHGVPARHPHHGALMKLPPDGSKLEVVARGFRANNGIGVGPNGELTSIDNQGHWMPGNRLNWIKPGSWQGYQWAWNPEGRTTYDQPLCWMHNFVDRSGGTQLWVPTDQWGPLRGELITISYGMGHIFLVLKEEVGGQMQGAVTRFPLEFETGVMRGVFHPKNGQLYTAGLYGWAGNKTRAGGFYRVRHTGKPVRLPNAFHVASDGLVLGFSDRLEASSATDPGNYDVKAWNYRWTAQYGSPDFKLDGKEGRDSWRVESATLSGDRKTVFLKVPELQPVMQMHVVFNLKAADGAPVQNFVHGTIHQRGPKSGAEWLGAGAIAKAGEAQIKLAQEAPGLAQSFARPGESDWQDSRVSRLAALFVPAGTPPTPFLAPGPFRARWEGFLKLGLNDEMTFELQGRGAVRLRLNDKPVFDNPGPQLDGLRSPPVALRSGLNRFELDYESLPSGEGEFRLLWFSKSLSIEPVPPTAFVHDASHPALRERAEVRAGRTLFASHQCAQCHQPESPWSTNAMPELHADAPSFNGIGSRLNEAWMGKWLLDPKSIRPDALMPRMVFGESAEADARDLAAFLASLKAPTGGQTVGARKGLPPVSPLTPALSPSRGEGGASETLGQTAQTSGRLQPNSSEVALRQGANDSSVASLAAPSPLNGERAGVRGENSTGLQMAGARLFADLGCAACHLLPDEPPLTHDTRVLLGHVAAKWQPAALEAFLRAPAKHFAWTRMPDFQLTTNEAAALTEFLLSRSAQAKSTLAAPESASRERGRQLVTSRGCLACHTLEGEKDTFTAPALARLLGREWNRGCLTEDHASADKAPQFGFTPGQRQALRQFARADARAALVRDTPAEFAARQYVELRCNACHPRDHETDLLTSLEAAARARQAAQDDAEEGGSVHLGRPPLTFVGEKLYAGWMERFMNGTLPYKPRAELKARMPAFAAYARGLAEGLAHEHGYPAETASRLAVDPALAEIGKKLTAVNDGFSCVACHDVGTQKALAGKDTATVNFSAVAERLRPSFYWRYIADPPHVLSSTMMPKFIGDDGTTPIKTVYDGDPQRQFTAIWHYLHSLRGAATK
jgi:cytochrome c2